MTSIHLPRLAALVAATLVAAAGLVGLSTTPAEAALCSKSGVNVVVDFNALGGGVQKGCDPGGAGKSADKVFPAAGFKLDFVNGSGFVCKVENLPGGGVCAKTPPANAYWGLFWSDGKSGRWTYATTGVGGLSVPSGGFVAFGWQDSSSRHQPAAAPVNNQPAPTPTTAPTKQPTKAPTKKPTKKPTKAPTKKPTKASSKAPTKAPKTPTPTTAPAATAGTTRAPAAPGSAAAPASASASASAGPSPPESASTTIEPEGTGGASPDVTSAQEADNAFTPEDEPSGLPAWVPVTVIVALGGAAGVAVWWRRRTGAA